MNWRDKARPNQLPPEGDWRNFMFVAGRGAGKSWAAANWLVEQAILHPRTNWAVIAPTWRDCRLLCMEGWDGICKTLQGALEHYDKVELCVSLTNGSKIYGFSADGVDRLQAVSGAWIDDLHQMPQVGVETWERLIRPCLGAYGRAYVTSSAPYWESPATPLFSKLYHDPGVIKTTGSTWENSENLSPKALEELRKRYGRTPEGRAVLDGEVLAA